MYSCVFGMVGMYCDSRLNPGTAPNSAFAYWGNGVVAANPPAEYGVPWLFISFSISVTIPSGFPCGLSSSCFIPLYIP